MFTEPTRPTHRGAACMLITTVVLSDRRPVDSNRLVSESVFASTFQSWNSDTFSSIQCCSVHVTHLTLRQWHLCELSMLESTDAERDKT